MPYCIECGTKIDEEDKFCPECGAKSRHKEDKEKEEKKESEKESEKVIIEKHYEPKKSGVGGFIKTIFILGIIIGAIIFGFIILGEISSKGGIEQAIDPCLRARDNCYSGCGEGVLSTITFCKDRCDNDYRKCKNR